MIICRDDFQLLGYPSAQAGYKVVPDLRYRACDHNRKPYLINRQTRWNYTASFDLGAGLGSSSPTAQQ